MLLEKKDGVVPVHVTKVHRGRRGIVPLILNLGVRCRWLVNFTPRQETLYSFRGWVGIGVGIYGFAEGKLLPLPRFQPRTIQLLASSYTDIILAPSNASGKTKLSSALISILFVAIRNASPKQYQLWRAESFLISSGRQAAEKCAIFMQPEGSLPCSQQPATRPQWKPNHSMLKPINMFI